MNVSQGVKDLILLYEETVTSDNPCRSSKKILEKCDQQMALCDQGRVNTAVRKARADVARKENSLATAKLRYEDAISAMNQRSADVVVINAIRSQEEQRMELIRRIADGTLVAEGLRNNPRRRPH